MKYDIIIIGGGPGGIYSAYELVKGNPALKSPCLKRVIRWRSAIAPLTGKR